MTIVKEPANSFLTGWRPTCRHSQLAQGASGQPPRFAKQSQLAAAGDLTRYRLTAWRTGGARGRGSTSFDIGGT
jgi:hypothetical protein